MRLTSRPIRSWKTLLGTVVLGIAGTSVQAQTLPSAPAPATLPPIAAAPAQTPVPNACIPCPSVIPSPGGIPMPGTTPTPGDMTGTTPSASAGDFRSVTSGAGYSGNTAVGYIDSAIPQTQLRIRFDSAYDDNRPDRAAFFYPKCGCFGTPDAKGPPKPESSVDYQELSTYLEIAASERFSLFGEVPVRFINPEVNDNATGISDVNFGFKYAFLMDPCQVATFQLRTSAPSGDPFKGLGDNDWRMEPAFLYYRRLSERLFLEAELRDNIPLSHDSDFTGNVMRYGVGVSYQAYKGCSVRLTPVTEVVGWTVLSGKELDETYAKNASGDTIVNLKLGMRVGFGDLNSPGMLNQSDVYLGYGRALTGDVWYKDIVRMELRLRF